MGYRMAINLRKKIPASDHLLIQDVNTTALRGFMQETGGHGTRIAKDARQVAEESVSVSTSHATFDMVDLLRFPL